MSKMNDIFQALHSTVVLLKGFANVKYYERKRIIYILL